MPQALAGVSIRPPPPKRLTTFTYGMEDVENAAMDLLAPLGEPRTVEIPDPDATVTSALLIGDKDAKSINALAVRTDRCAGLPRPKGSIVVCIHFDNQSKGSFEYYLDASGIKLHDEGERPFFIEMLRGKGRHRGLIDPEDPSNGSYIVDVFREVLRRLRERRDVGLLVTDHFGLFIEKRGIDYAMVRGGTEKLFDKNSSPDWNARTRMFEGVNNLQQSVPVPGGFFIGTGYENQRDGEEKTVVKKDGSRVQEVVPEKWVSKVRENYPVIIRVKVMRNSDFAPVQWLGFVQTGRSKFFMAGQKADLTNRNIGAFYEDRMAALANGGGVLG